MSKKLSFSRSLSPAFALTACALVTCALLLLPGCELFPGDEKFYKVTVPPQKLREVETLQLQPAKNDEPNRPDPNLAAPDQLELTLEQCRTLAMENNLELKVQLISPTIAAQRISEEEARFEAAFFSNLAYVKTDNPVATQFDLVGSQVDASSMDFGVQVPLQTGGTITFDLADRRTKTNVTYPTFNPSYNSDATLSISQPLLRGAGTRANTHAIRIAEYERQITDARTKLELIRILASIDRVYWRLYAARRELDVRRQQYDLAEAQLQQARRFVNSGERAPIEVTRAEAGVAERLEAIIVAENNLRDRQRELKRVLNKPALDIQTPTVLIPATEPDPLRYELEKKQLVQIAVENRMEMLELELQIAEDISSIDYMHNQALPLVTMDYTYNISGLGPTEDDSFDLLYDKRFEDHQFGLQLLVPLGNEAAKSRLRQAFYQRKQRLASRENRSTLIEMEVLNAIDQLEANWQRILASRQRAILDGRLYQAEKHQFELGLRTTTDVFDAQTKFADAQSSEILALAEYQIAIVDLAYATGTLLGAAKVRWEPIVPEIGG